MCSLLGVDRRRARLGFLLVGHATVWYIWKVRNDLSQEVTSRLSSNMLMGLFFILGSGSLVNSLGVAAPLMSGRQNQFFVDTFRVQCCLTHMDLMCLWGFGWFQDFEVLLSCGCFLSLFLMLACWDGLHFLLVLCVTEDLFGSLGFFLIAFVFDYFFSTLLFFFLARPIRIIKSENKDDLSRCLNMFGGCLTLFGL